MNHKGYGRLCRRLRATTATLGLTMVLTASLFWAESAQGQQFTVIFNFSGYSASAYPEAGFAFDRAGNLYGTSGYGSGGGGSVFKLRHGQSGWTLAPLYIFDYYQNGYLDGWEPYSPVTLGSDGRAYGTTFAGGPACNDGPAGCGVVFIVRPKPTVCPNISCGWDITIIHDFTGEDGLGPLGDLIFDQQGNIYGTTYYGGGACCCVNGCGTVYELSPSGGGWSHQILHSFPSESGGDATIPRSGVIFDQAGNLYGTASGGGANNVGAVFELTPSGQGWTESVLYSFQGGNDGASPTGGLIFDHLGNLYGTTTLGGPGSGGTVFELTPSGGKWTYQQLYTFEAGDPLCLYNDYCGPLGSLVMDAAGNLYGTTSGDGAYGYGNVFKLAAGSGGWTYTSLYDFTGGTDGANPVGSLIMDANGNLYGATTNGGMYTDGVAFEITP